MLWRDTNLLYLADGMLNLRRSTDWLVMLLLLSGVHPNLGPVLYPVSKLGCAISSYLCQRVHRLKETVCSLLHYHCNQLTVALSRCLLMAIASPMLFVSYFSTSIMLKTQPVTSLTWYVLKLFPNSNDYYSVSFNSFADFTA